MTDFEKKKKAREQNEKMRAAIRRHRSLGEAAPVSDEELWRVRTRRRLALGLLVLIPCLAIPLYVMFFDLNEGVYLWLALGAWFASPFSMLSAPRSPWDLPGLLDGRLSEDDLLSQIKNSFIARIVNTAGGTAFLISFLGFCSSFREAGVLWLDVPAIFWVSAGLCLLALILICVTLSQYRKKCREFREDGYVLTLSELTDKQIESGDRDSNSDLYYFYFENAKISRSTGMPVSQAEYNAAKIGDLYYLLIAEKHIEGVYRASDYELDAKIRQKLIIEESDPALGEKRELRREALVREAQERSSPEEPWVNAENEPRDAFPAGSEAAQKKKAFSPIPLLCTLVLLAIVFLFLREHAAALLPPSLLPLFFYAGPIHRYREGKKSGEGGAADSKPLLLTEHRFLWKTVWENVNAGVVLLTVGFVLGWMLWNLLEGDGKRLAIALLLAVELVLIALACLYLAKRVYRERTELLKEGKLKILELPVVSVTGRNSNYKCFLTFPSPWQNKPPRLEGGRVKIPSSFWEYRKFPRGEEPKVGELFYLLVCPNKTGEFSVMECYRKKEVLLSPEMTRYLATLRDLQEE